MKSLTFQNFGYLLKERNHKEVYCKGQCYLQNNDQRYSEHKFNVLGLMAYELHSEIHSHRAAECREEQESRLSGPVLRVVFGGYLVVYAHDYGNKRYYAEISES